MSAVSLFETMIEMLATAFLADADIQGIRIDDFEHYMLMMLGFFSCGNIVKSLACFNKLIALFAKASGDKVNEQKSILMNLDLMPEEKECISMLYKWKCEGIWYLGVKISSSIIQTCLLDKNIVPLVHWMHCQFDKWSLLFLSWNGRIAVIKMSILPKFCCCCFHNLIISISQSILNKIQSNINRFIWTQRKPRVKSPILQLKKPWQGCLASPDIGLHLGFLLYFFQLCYIPFEMELPNCTQYSKWPNNRFNRGLQDWLLCF